MSDGQQTIRIDTPMGVDVAGYLSVPQDATRPLRGSVIFCHGFSGARYPEFVETMVEAGFAVVAIDFPGYGDSGGDPRRVVAAEQVAAVRAAADFLDRLENGYGPRSAPYALVGSSLGGSIALLALSEDPRFKACVACCPLADGESVLRRIYPTAAEWERFNGKLAQAESDGSTFHRFEVVYIPEHMRRNLPEGTPMEFSADTVRSFLDLSLEGPVARIRDVPLLLIHAKDDEVVPVDESIKLADIAQTHCDLELLEAGNHFILRSGDVGRQITQWLEDHIGGAAT